MPGNKSTPETQAKQQSRVASDVSNHTDVTAFVKQARTLAAVAPASGPAQGRLIFAMDATASRQPSWDSAAVLQAEMFDAVAAHWIFSLFSSVVFRNARPVPGIGMRQGCVTP